MIPRKKVMSLTQDELEDALVGFLEDYLGGDKDTWDKAVSEGLITPDTLPDEIEEKYDDFCWYYEEYKKENE